MKDFKKSIIFLICAISLLFGTLIYNYETQAIVVMGQGGVVAVSGCACNTEQVAQEVNADWYGTGLWLYQVVPDQGAIELCKIEALVGDEGADGVIDVFAVWSDAGKVGVKYGEKLNLPITIIHDIVNFGNTEAVADFSAAPLEIPGAFFIHMHDLADDLSVRVGNNDNLGGLNRQGDWQDDMTFKVFVCD